VWAGSREVGIGRARSRDGKWFVVANFFPAGNFIGRNAQNVFPPRDGKVAIVPPTTKQAAAAHRGPGRVDVAPQADMRSSASQGNISSAGTTFSLAGQTRLDLNFGCFFPKQ